MFATISSIWEGLRFSLAAREIMPARRAVCEADEVLKNTRPFAPAATSNAHRRPSALRRGTAEGFWRDLEKEQVVRMSWLNFLGFAAGEGGIFWLLLAVVLLAILLVLAGSSSKSPNKSAGTFPEGSKHASSGSKCG